VPVLPAGQNWFNNIWLKAHPGYDPLIVGSTDGVSNGLGAPDKVLLRVINMGLRPSRCTCTASTARSSAPTSGAGLGRMTRELSDGSGLEKNTLTIGSGETYEWLLDFGAWAGKATGAYGLGTQTRYFNNVGTCIGILNAPAPLTVQTARPLSTHLLRRPYPPLTYVGGPTVGPALPDPDAGSVPGALVNTRWDQRVQRSVVPVPQPRRLQGHQQRRLPCGMFTMIATVP